jgi:hypothetical protein
MCVSLSPCSLNAASMPMHGKPFLTEILASIGGQAGLQPLNMNATEQTRSQPARRGHASSKRKPASRTPNIIPESDFQRVLGRERHEMLKRREQQRRAGGLLPVSTLREQSTMSEHDWEGDAEGEAANVEGEDQTKASVNAMSADKQQRAAADHESALSLSSSSSATRYRRRAGDNVTLARLKNQRVRELRDLDSEPSSKFAKYRNADGEIDVDAYTIDMYKNVKEVLDVGKRHVNLALAEHAEKQAASLLKEKKKARKATARPLKKAVRG